jgi:pimeloyl-ACP methyl ester carboxylesterase
MSVMLTADYDWSKEVAAIKIPTMLVFGDADAVRPLHMVEVFALLGGGQKDAGWDRSGMSNARLAILPDQLQHRDGRLVDDLADMIVQEIRTEEKLVLVRCF